MQTKNILVGDLYHQELSSLVVQSNERFINAIKAFTKGTYDGIFVVDSQQKYRGRIERHDIIEWAKFQMGDASGMEPNLYQYPAETRAEDAVRRHSERSFVEPSSPIDDALKWMLSTEHYVIPVIENEKIVGDISLTDIVLALIE